MITDAILGVLRTVLHGVINLLPQMDAIEPPQMQTSAWWGYASLVSSVMPWDVALGCAEVGAFLFLMVQGSRIVLYLLSLFHITGADS